MPWIQRGCWGLERLLRDRDTPPHPTPGVLRPGQMGGGLSAGPFSRGPLGPETAAWPQGSCLHPIVMAQPLPKGLGLGLQLNPLWTLCRTGAQLLSPLSGSGPGEVLCTQLRIRQAAARRWQPRPGPQPARPRLRGPGPGCGLSACESRWVAGAVASNLWKDLPMPGDWVAELGDLPPTISSQFWLLMSGNYVVTGNESFQGRSQSFECVYFSLTAFQ